MARKSQMTARDFVIGLENHCAHDPGVRAAKVQLAREGVRFAQSIAPVDEGDYQDGIKVLDEADRVGIEFSDWKSRLLEYGTERTPEFGVMRKTAEALRRYQ